MDSPKTMRIVELKAENVKRLKAIEIRPDGNVVVIGGKNGQGKSSTLDAIAYAIGGKKLMPAKPVREGEKSASVSVDLGDLIVTRTITASGGGSLKVTNRDGLQHSSPQKILDDLTGTRTGLVFDPLAFIRLDAKKQLETLREIVGLDFAELDAERKRLFDERSAINRAAKEAKALVDRLPGFPNAPKEAVSVAALSDQLQVAHATEKAHDSVRADLEHLQHHHHELIERMERDNAELARIRDRIKETRKSLDEADAKIVEGQKAADEAFKAIVDPSEIHAKIAAAEEANRQVRANVERENARAEFDRREKQADRLTAAIDKIDEQKRAALSGASFPVQGMSFDESGVLLDGVPFEQASGAQQLRSSMAISFALNPRLRIALIRDASLLDEDSMKLVAEMAAERDCQIWLERVGKGEEVSVVIEDGEVSEVRNV